MAAQRTKFILDEDRIPRAWYNIAADLPVPAAAVAPSRHRPADRPRRPRAAVPDGAHQQEVSTDREIEIPEPVRDAYRCTGPRPLYRAHRLEEALDTPAHIYYKYEGGSPSGSHKPNTAIAAGVLQQGGGRRRGSRPRRAPGSGGARWRSPGALFGLEVKVYMVRSSYDQKPYRRILMETYGAAVVPSPQRGHELRPQGPRRDARQHRARSASRSARRSRTPSTREDTKYSLGSVLDFVLLHQTVIGQEAMEQMELAGEEPDVAHRLRRRRLELRRA